MRGNRGWSLMFLLFIFAAFVAAFPLIFAHIETSGRLANAYERWTMLQRSADFIPILATDSANYLIGYKLPGGAQFEIRMSALPAGGLNKRSINVSSFVDSGPSGFAAFAPLQAELGGDGSLANPFVIASIEKLDLLRANVEADKHFVIADNIDFSSDPEWSGKTWSPIGTKLNPFSGTVQALKDESGNSYTISGVKVDAATTNSDFYGFFGVVKGGKLIDLSIKDIKVAGGTSKTASSGGLAGTIEGNTEIVNCQVTGEVSGNSNVGGLVGKSILSTILRSNVVVGVSSSGTGNAVGGLVGYSNGTISFSKASGEVSGGNQIGGLVGFADVGCAISSSQASATVSGIMSIGGFIGEAASANSVQCSAFGPVAGSGNNVGGFIGKASGGSVASCLSTGKVTGKDYYIGGLNGINSACTISNSYASGDVNGSGIRVFVGGLVGGNINSVISKCYATGAVTGLAYIGGLVGSHEGTITRCYAEGNINASVVAGGLVGFVKSGSVTQSYAQGTVTCANTAGGLAGNNQGAVDSCYARGAVVGDIRAGGLLGTNNTTGSVINGYSTGSVTATTLAGGLIGYNLNLPGVTYCYWDLTTSGQTVSQGGEGRTTTQLKQAVANSTISSQIIYQNWVDATWHFNPTTEYPRLKNTYTMILAAVPGGKFQRDNIVTNTSTVSSFQTAINEVTQQQYMAVTGLANPSSTIGMQTPVQTLSWYAALAFCNRLSILEGLTPAYTISGSTNPTVWGAVPTAFSNAWSKATCNWTANGYRLNSEDEWQWAAMGAADARTKAFAGSDGTNNILDYAWFSLNSSAVLQPSAKKLVNELGLYDMSGNMFEIIWDRAGTATGARIDYHGPTTGTSRIVRGGDYTRVALYQTVAYSIRTLTPYTGYANVGFRISRKM